MHDKNCNDMDTKMTVVAEFTNARDANIAAGMLENNGIQCHVVDDAMSTLYGAGATWAPVRLFTSVGDAERAAALLAQHGDI